MSKRKAKNLMTDRIHLRGALEYQLLNALDGSVVQQGRCDNTVVTVGRVWMLNRLASNNASVLDRIYLGTDATAPTTGDTALGASFSSATAVISSAGYTANPPYYEFSKSWSTDGTDASSSAIKEFGLYASSTMVGHVTTSTINFGSTNTLAVTYRLSN